MNKTELKDLVKRYFNLTENNSNNLEKEVFADAELIDGTKITNMKDSEFAEGDEIHVITESGEHVIAPSGEHELKSGIVITLDEQGKITGIKRPDAEGEGSLEAAESPVAEEMAADTQASEEKTAMAEIDEEMEDEIIEEVMQEDEIKEAVVEAIAEVIAPEIEAMKRKMADIEEAMKEYMSTPADVPTSEKKFSKNAKAELKPEVLNQKRYEMALNRINNK